jgi:ribosomal protein S18 acetylase RimI-like enzyme
VLRPLSANDGDAVHRLDTSLTGGSRTEFLRRRLLRALRAPRERLQIAADDRGALQGFLLARVAGGEFGRPHRVAVIEAVGVAPEAGHAGLGHRLVDALAELALPREVREIASQARWTDRSILALFEWAGFSLAPRHILERGTRLSLREEEDEDEADGEDRSSRVCALHAGDVDAIVAIDQRITGFDRGSYLTRIVEEALARV